MKQSVWALSIYGKDNRHVLQVGEAGKYEDEFKKGIDKKVEPSRLPKVIYVKA